MKFINEKPFRANTGEIITMKAVITTVHIQCYENQKEYKPEQLTPITEEEYQDSFNLKIE